MWRPIGFCLLLVWQLQSHVSSGSKERCLVTSSESRHKAQSQASRRNDSCSERVGMWLISTLFMQSFLPLWLKCLFFCHLLSAWLILIRLLEFLCFFCTFAKTLLIFAYGFMKNNFDHFFGFMEHTLYKFGQTMMHFRLTFLFNSSFSSPLSLLSFFEEFEELVSITGNKRLDTTLMSLNVRLHAATR